MDSKNLKRILVLVGLTAVIAIGGLLLVAVGLILEGRRRLN